MVNIILDDGAIMPTRAHKYDAGLDLYAKNDGWVWFIPTKHSIFNTGVHVQIPEGYAGFLKSKSGLNIKHSITSEGVIDTGYTGAIVVKLYKHSLLPRRIHKGDKITQLVVVKISLDELNVISEFEETERGDGGFGSTGT